MKISAQLPLITSITVFISIVMITGFAIYNFKQTSVRNIEAFRTEELEKVKQHIKDVVDLSYEMIASSYQNSRNAELIEQSYGMQFNDSMFSNLNLSDRILNITLENLRVLRYGENDEGYIWINNINLPYKVIMHPTMPELEGQRLDKPEFNLVKGTKQNVYAAFADIGNKHGEGFLEYDFYKPGNDTLKPKISYIKLFKPKNWIIGTGIYIDNIDLMVAKKRRELDTEINNLILTTIVVGSILVSLSFIVLFRFGNYVSRLINQIRDQLLEMSQGKMVEKLSFRRRDEIGQMKESVDALIDSLTKYVQFARQIGKGNLNAEFTAVSREDVLGNSLIDMRKSLQEARIEEEKRREETAKRNWATEGVAKFGEILREHSDDIEALSYNIISNMVKYMNANQGGMFLYNNDTKMLDLVATYAFGRKKLNQKKVRLGEGLIGTCALEKETVFLTEIPDDYIKVTSGLGQANPKSLLIVPMKLENEIFGVIELASFEVLQDYEVDFVERISQTIASTLSSVRINEQTSHLLEQSRLQAEEMRQKEEAMRKSLEELEVLRSQLALQRVDEEFLIKQ